MFGSHLLPVVCGRAHVLFTLSVFLVAYSGVQHTLRCVFVLFFMCSNILLVNATYIKSSPYINNTHNI